MDYSNKMTGEVIKEADGCPVGVQVVGRHYQEESVLSAMKLIETSWAALESNSLLSWMGDYPRDGW